MTIITQNQLGLRASCGTIGYSNPLNTNILQSCNGSNYTEVSAAAIVFSLGSNSVDFDMPQNGRLRYIGASQKKFIISFNVSYAPASVPPVNLLFQLQKSSSGSAIPNGQARAAPNSNSITHFMGITNVIEDLETNQYVSLWLKWDGSSSINLNINSILISAFSVGP